MDDQRYRTILSHWAATVSVLAVRDDDRVHGTTATSFTPVAADPPTILVSLGPNAQVRPFLDVGSTFVVNMLDEMQTRLAAVYAVSARRSPRDGRGPRAPRLHGHENDRRGG